MPELSSDHARHFFSSNGFVVEDIPTVIDQKRADLRVFADGEEYVVEAKERQPHHEWIAAMARAEQDGFAETAREPKPWEVIARRVAGAREQLMATPASPDAFRMLWFVALHGDADFVISCVERQLTGKRLVFAYDVEDLRRGEFPAPKARQCFYFDENDFERYPEIDAAMLCTREGGQLLVNSYSPNIQRFRAGRLYRLLGDYGAVLDADVLTNAGRALMLGTDFKPPRAEGSQQRYLRDRYGLATSTGIESHWQGLAVVPVDPGAETPRGGSDGG